MKFIVNGIEKTLSESVCIDSLKAKFVAEGYEFKDGVYTNGEKTVEFVNEAKSDRAGIEKELKSIKGKWDALNKFKDDKISSVGYGAWGMSDSDESKYKKMETSYENAITKLTKSIGDKRVSFTVVQEMVWDSSFADRVLGDLFNTNESQDLNESHNESFNEAFKAQEFNGIVDEAIKHLYKGLNEFDSAIAYLKKNGQGGAVGAFKKKNSYDALKKLIENIDYVNESVKIDEAEKITGEFNDGYILFTDSKGNETEEYTHQMDDSFNFKGKNFTPEFGEGTESDWKKGLKNLEKEMGKAFKGKYKFVLESETINEGGLTHTSDTYELDYNGKKKKYVETVIKKGKSEWKIIDYGGDYFDVYKYQSGKKVGLSRMGKTFFSWDEFADNYKSIKDYILNDVKDDHLANRAFVGMTKGIVEGVSKDDLDNVVDGTILKLGNFNTFEVTGKGKKEFTGNLMDNKGKVVSVTATVPFSNFSNPHYNKNITIMESMKEMISNMYENLKPENERSKEYWALFDTLLKKYEVDSFDDLEGGKKLGFLRDLDNEWESDDEIKANKDKMMAECDDVDQKINHFIKAATLIQKWVGFESVYDIGANLSLLDSLPRLEPLIKIALLGGNNKNVYDYMSNVFLKGNITQEDIILIDSIMETFKK